MVPISVIKIRNLLFFLISVFLLSAPAYAEETCADTLTSLSAQAATIMQEANNRLVTIGALSVQNKNLTAQIEALKGSASATTTNQ